MSNYWICLETREAPLSRWTSCRSKLG